MLFCVKKTELKFKTCEICSNKLFTRIISKYRKYYIDKEKLVKKNYLEISKNYTLLLIKNLNKKLTNDEIKLLNRSNCIFHISNLIDKINDIEDKTFDEFIKNN